MVKQEVFQTLKCSLEQVFESIGQDSCNSSDKSRYNRMSSFLENGEWIFGHSSL